MEYPRLAPKTSPFSVLPAFDSVIKTSPGMQMRAAPIQTRAVSPSAGTCKGWRLLAPTARLSPIMKVLLKISTSDTVIVSPRRTGQSKIIATQRRNKPFLATNGDIATAKQHRTVLRLPATTKPGKGQTSHAKAASASYIARKITQTAR